MQTANNKKAKLFQLKMLPLDMSRLILYPMLLFAFRCRKFDKNGEKYRKKLKGNAIIASNHFSQVDAMKITSAFWYRRMYYFIAEIVMKGRIRNFLLSKAGGIKIDRNLFDIEAINKAVDVLKNGHVLSIFPQGGVKKDGKVEEVKSGAVLIAQRADAPIYPVFIKKRKHWYNCVKVYIGDPIYPSQYVKGKFMTAVDLENISQDLMKAINECANN